MEGFSIIVNVIMSNLICIIINSNNAYYETSLCQS